MSNRYYLSLGGNIEPERNLPATVRLLGNYGKVLAVSQVYESPPAGAREDQPNYLNAAVLVESELGPQEFHKTAIGEIERALGRVRTDDKFAARTIDIDILLVNQDILQIEHRNIPNPEICTRSFVAVPLAEIAGDYVHPETKEPLREIARRLSRSPGSQLTPTALTINASIIKSC